MTNAPIFLKNHKVNIILLIGILVRLIALTKEIGFDEALSLFLAQQPLHKIMRYHLTALDLTFPFFNSLLHFWLAVSTSLLWARCFPLIWGIVIIYISYKLALYLCDEHTALITTLFISFSEAFIFHSVDLRQYSLFTLLALLSLFYFLKFIKFPSIKNSLFYIVFTILAIYSHFFGFFILLINASVLFLYKNKLLHLMKKWLISITCILPAISPLFFYYLNQYRIVCKGGTYPAPPSVLALIGLFLGYSDNKFFFMIYIFLCSLAVFVKYKNIKYFFLKVYANFSLSFSALTLFLPIITVLLLSTGRISIFSALYFLPYMTFFYLIISYILVHFIHPSLRRFIIVFLACAVFLNALRYSFFIGYSQPRKRPEKVVEFFKSQLREKDLLTILHPWNTLEIVALLRRPLRIITNQQHITEAKAFKSDFLSNYFFITDDFMVTEKSVLKNYNRLWIVTLDNENLSRITWLSENAHIYLIKQVKIDRYIVWLFDLTSKS